MARRFLSVRFLIAGIGFCAALLAAGWMFAASTRVAAGPVAPPITTAKPPVFNVVAVEPSAAKTVPAMAQPLPEKKKSTIMAMRAPVPMLPNARHTDFVADDSQSNPTITTLASATTPDGQDKSEAAQAARRMVEADGYKNVSALVANPDGTWTGSAMRGATRIAIKVDALGNVSAN